MTSKRTRKLKARIRFLEKENQSFYERFAQLTNDITELRARVRKLEAGQASPKPIQLGGDTVSTKGAPWMVPINTDDFPLGYTTAYGEPTKALAAEVDTHSANFASCLHPDCVAQRERSAAEELKEPVPVERWGEHTLPVATCQHPTCVQWREDNAKYYGV